MPKLLLEILKVQKQNSDEFVPVTTIITFYYNSLCFFFQCSLFVFYISMPASSCCLSKVSACSIFIISEISPSGVLILFFASNLNFFHIFSLIEPCHSFIFPPLLYFICNLSILYYMQLFKKILTNFNFPDSKSFQNNHQCHSSFFARDLFEIQNFDKD